LVPWIRRALRRNIGTIRASIQCVYSGAVLSAAIVVMVLRAQEPWYVATVTAAIAVVSKYIFRANGASVFNPAALALVAGDHLFHAGQSRWGTQTDVSGPAQLLLVAAGVFIANRVNKMPMVLVFLAAYFGLFTVTAFVSGPLPVAEIFATPDVEARCISHSSSGPIHRLHPRATAIR
jgi:Na+-translocating ferredoxin:NAD+ oxidoreductase RnfD subunit